MFKKVLIVTVILFSFASTASADTLYEVKNGDSLTKIAKLYKVTVNDLRTWNKLKKDNIYVKQKLIVQKPTTVKPEQLITSPGAIVDDSKQLSSNGQANNNLLVDIASRLEGIPYLYAGNTMAGFDCSGFIYFVHSQAGLSLTRQSSESYFTISETVENPIVGDLVFFENTYKEGISHMGIFIGNNQFIHAGTKGVEIASLDSTYWKEHFVSIKRFNMLSAN